MKNTICWSVILGSLLLTVPHAMADQQDVLSPKDKNLCILYKQNCPEHPANYQETVQEMIQNLKKEIDKGSQVYTADELEILNKKLRFEEEVWDLINN